MKRGKFCDSCEREVKRSEVRVTDEVEFCRYCRQEVIDEMDAHLGLSRG